MWKFYFWKNLNTSHVDIKHKIKICKENHIPYLNTSHVDIKPNKLYSFYM